MNKGILIAAIAITVILVGGVFVLGGGRKLEKPQIEKEEEKAANNQFVIGQKAPDFTLKDFNGNPIQLSSFYGQKAVVLDFWAAWCPFCVEEMPELESVHKEFGDKLVMIGVHRTDSGESVATGQKFADQRGVTYSLVQGTAEIYRAATSRITGMPVAVFIDKDGVVQDIKIGPKTAEEIRSKVSKLLQ